MTEEEKMTAAAIEGNEIPAPKKPEKKELSAEEQKKHDDIVGRITHTINKIRPYIQADGGDVQLVDYNDENGVVTVSMLGACAGCMAIDSTLTDGIEALLIDEVPEVTQVRLCPTGMGMFNPSSPFGF